METLAQRLAALDKLRVHPAAKILPLLNDRDFARLVADVRQNGLLVPILRFQGELLDGRNRYLACLAAKVSPRFAEAPLEGKSPLDLVLSLNLARRQISKSQAAAAAVLALPEFQIQAKARQLSVLRRGSKQAARRLCAQGRSNQLAATVFGISARYVTDARRLQEQSPSLFEKVQMGDLTLSQAKRAAREEGARTRKGHPPKGGTSCVLKLGDFRSIRIPAHSVDLILTDPPYSRADLPLWGALARLGQAALRPGGFLVALSGLYFLPEVLAQFEGKLTYYWTICVHLTGPSGRRLDKKLATAWRPALVWAKPPLAPPAQFFVDVIKSGGPDTTHHPWGQKRGCYDFIIEHFTRPGDLILDPMAGGGTVLESALALGRRAMGVEMDPKAFRQVQRRLGSLTNCEGQGRRKL